MEDIMIVFVIIFAFLGMSVILYMLPMNYEGYCVAEGIQYIDVSKYGAECPMNFNNRLCPMPSVIQCSFKGQANQVLINRILDK